jgi:SSS family transporter
MELTDYAVFCSYIGLMLVLGMVHARRRQPYSEYFLAGRSMHWVPVGLSIMVTAFSAINYTAFSGEVFRNGSYVLLCLPVFLFVAWPVTRVIMPLHCHLGVGSAYEYLERRFDGRVRLLASGMFIVWRLLWIATLIYVPCKVLALVTGASSTWLTLLVGAVATLYTLVGGMRAVMWTDVVQFIVLCGGVLLSLGVAVARHPAGLSGLLLSGVDGGLARPFYPYDPAMFSLEPGIRITIWSCWLGTSVAFLARYGADQVVVQRYFAARSLTHARRGFHLSYVSSVVALLLLALLGFAIHSHALASGLDPSGPAPPMLFFSQFVRSLPAGITGLIVAGLFAATMSSMDSGVNSCAAAVITDFCRRFGGAAEGRREELWSRLSIIAFGAVATALALQVGRLGSVFEIANRIINGMGSPLLALFVLGLFSRRTNTLGALAGGLLGTLASMYTCFTVESLALHYYAVMNLLVTMALIYGASLLENHLRGGATQDQLAFTWYDGVWRQAAVGRHGRRRALDAELGPETESPPCSHPTGAQAHSTDAGA